MHDQSRPFPAAPAGRSSPGHPGADPMAGGSRRVWWIAAAVAAAAGIAILVGLAASGDDGARSPAAAAGAGRVAPDGGAATIETTAASPASGAVTGPAAGDPGTAGAPALSASLGPGAAEIRVGRIEHPVVAVVVASGDGVVERIHVKAGGSVTTGQKLYSLRAGKGVRSSEAIVSAPAAGRIERRAARGDRVAEGDVLAQLVDPDRWLVIADLPSDLVTTGWSCTIATSEGRNRAPCRVESVQRLRGEQSRATVTVATAQAAWLQGGEQALLLRLIPPDAVDEPGTATTGSSAAAGSTGAGGEAPGGSSAEDRAASPTGRGPDGGR